MTGPPGGRGKVKDESRLGLGPSNPMSHNQERMPSCLVGWWNEIIKKKKEEENEGEAKENALPFPLFISCSKVKRPMHHLSSGCH